jgi:hypothetical protein
MTYLRILLWGFICYGIGTLLNWAFSPSHAMHCAVLFAIPFILFGFQEDSLFRKSSRSVIGMPLYANHTDHKRLTFWGIPIGGRKEGQRNFGVTISAVARSSDYRNRHLMPVVVSKMIHNR